MTSSTSLYSSTPGNANVASKNFTTLYSGSGAINPTQAYGNANVVSLLAVGTDGANTIGNISATGNVTAAYFIGNINAGNIVGNVNFANTAGTAQFVTGNAQANITSVGTLTSLSVTGNVTGGNLLTGGTITATGNVTAPNFIGNVIGNLLGNVAAAGSNTQIQFNTGNILDASANLTFNKSTSTIKVTGNSSFPSNGLEITANTITGNLALGNLLITNQFQASSRGAVVIDTTELIVGQDNAALSTNATVRAIRNQALELTTTNAGAPAVYVGKYVANNASLTGNVDVRSSNVGGYAGTGNINLSGNVYVGRNAQGSDTANAKANLIVSDGVYVAQGISAVGNIQGNVFIGNGAGLTNINASNIIGAYGNANVSNFLATGFGSNTIVTTGNITGGNVIASGNLFGNVVGQVFTSPGNANVIIRQIDAVNQANAVYVDANNLIIGNVGNSSKLVAATSNDLILAVSGTGGAQMYVAQAPTGNLDLRSSGGAISGGFAANGNINLSGNVFIGNGAQQTAPASTGLNLAVAGTISAAGNITANATSFFIGNGSQLTGIVSSYGNANVAANLAAFANNPISTSGNITAGNINTTNYVAFGTAGAQTTAATGQMFWDTAEQTVSLGMNNGVTQQIGLEQYILVKASATITNGQAVMFTGANGDNVLAAPADTTSVGFRPEYIIGVATQDIANNAFGYITTFGSVHGLNTNAYTVGDILWVSNSTPGALTNTRPTDPNYQIEIAAVTKKAGGDGHIQVRVTPFNNIDSLTDVTITTPATGQSLVYSGNVWINGNPQLANTANTVTNNAQANITSVGTLTSLSVSGNVDAGNLRTAGQVSATGNVSAGNVIVPVNGKYYGDFTTGTTAGRTVFQTTATGTSAATSLTAVPGPNHITSNTAFSSQINLFANGTDLGNSAFGRMQMFGNRLNFEATAAGTGAVGNMRFAAGSAQIVLLNTGNVGIGNANPNHAFSTNETFIGGNISVTANVIAGNVNTVGEVSATGNVVGGNINTGGVVSATGNITGANLVASANLTSTQQTVVGTANNGSTGNIVMSGRNLATDMAYSPDGATGTTQYLGRVMVGTGWAGNIAVGQPSRLSTMDMINRGNTATSLRQLESDSIVNLTANVSNTSFRQQAFGARLRVGGGSAGNSTVFSSGVGIPFTIAAAQLNLDIGNQSPYLLGNASVSHAALNTGALSLNAGSSIGNAYGYVPFINAAGSGGTANITNYIGVASSFASANVTGNLFCFYNGNATSVGSYSVQTSNNARAATNYYFLRNDDNVAQVQLGSLRSYNEFQYSTATTGTVNIDKNNAQVQFLNPTANVTIGDFQNFVTTANDSVNNDNQSDTVTLIIQQGATPYTVTMPTGNAAIKYLGGTTTVGSTANAVSVVTIQAVRSAANAALYLTAISSEYT